MKNEFFILSNEISIPSIGYGTGLLLEESEKAVEIAIENGYRHIDTARFYQNEKYVGRAIKKILEKKILKREDLYITTKIWNDLSIDPELDVLESLKELQLEYVDLCLLHWPFGKIDSNFVMKQHPCHIIWKKLENCVKKGFVKSIGVSNFNCQTICDLLSFAEIKPVVNQIEVHPYLNQNDLINFCNKQGIHTMAFCPMAKGGPTKNLVFSSDNPEIFNEAIIKNLALKYNKTEAQIILNFEISRGVSVLTRSLNNERMIESLNSNKFTMEKSDIDLILTLNRNLRKVDPKTDVELFQKTPIFD